MPSSAATSAAGRSAATLSQQAFQVVGSKSDCMICSARRTRRLRLSLSANSSMSLYWPATSTAAELVAHGRAAARRARSHQRFRITARNPARELWSGPLLRQATGVFASPESGRPAPGRPFPAEGTAAAPSVPEGGCTNRRNGPSPRGIRQVIRADRFDSLAINDGMLELRDLAAGDYD